MELREQTIEEKHTVNKRKTKFNDADFDEKSYDSEDDKNAKSAIKELEKIKTQSGRKSGNVHKDHRQRLKSQYLQNGISALTDVQKLELLLFYAIPQKDTNPLAHKLLDEMGSLRNIFTADPALLEKVKGIKQNSSILLSLIGDLFNEISKPETNYHIGSTTEAKEFCSKLFVGVEVEQFYVICLNRSNRVTKYKMIQSGTVDEVNLQIRSITQFAIEQKCSRIIVCHNHPVGKGTISDEDTKFTYSLICSCILNNIDIVDHIIVGSDKAVSMHTRNLLGQLKMKAFENLQLPVENGTFISDVSEEYIIDEDLSKPARLFR